MFPLAHAGFPVLAGLVAARAGVRLPPQGLALLALGGLLPDLLDKPLGLALGVAEGRLVGHTLLFAAVWLGAGRLVGGSWTRPPALLGWGCLSHVLLDLPLAAATVLWPLLGAMPVRGVDYADLWTWLLGTPHVLLAEAIGAAVLAAVGVAAWRRRGPGRRGDGGAGVQSKP